MTAIKWQIELTNYLYACETNGRLDNKLLYKIVPIQNCTDEPEGPFYRPMTLFGDPSEKLRLAAAVLATGTTVEAGYDLALK
jgi:hypothetical protein